MLVSRAAAVLQSSAMTMSPAFRRALACAVVLAGCGSKRAAPPIADAGADAAAVALDAAPEAGGSGGATGHAACIGGRAPGDAGTTDAGDGGGGVPAFPGAEGFGRMSRGGRGGCVCHVTTLDDAGPGSLRDCVSGSFRTVVFDVGGWITLASNLGVASSNITLAGQTAPGGGIGVRGERVSFGGANVVVRFMRFRRGTIANTLKDDSLLITSSADNVVVDHCSVGFGVDENFSMPGDEPTGPHNLTVQWTINGYGLQQTNHSAGSLLTANDTTIHHTLWALNKTRNPRGRTSATGILDWVNNVIFGWDAHHPYGERLGWSLSWDPFMMANTGSGMHRANAVGNVFISLRAADFAFDAGFLNAAGVPAFNLYFADNILDGNANGVFDVSKSDWTMVAPPATALVDRLPAPEVTTDAPTAAYARVLDGVGATLPARDEVDAVLIAHVRAQTGLLITTEADLTAEGVSNGGFGTLAPGTPPLDTDGDGMPDAWETANGLDPQDPADGSADADGDGYTNLEAYLASLVPPSP
jgi:hypothetical protein